ncbi:unnamed protein product [Hymenolepis diminuta]|uniref:Uncharacterized protein n=1 Tax=Hymenolepis diminuta TaxID=6216 RepID=A0A564Y7R4_HYMDI|nr:unnamed protein product [Hymenolepis diminuta]
MRLAMLILVAASPVACIRSVLTALTESFLLSALIVVLTPVFIERTVSMKVKITTKLALRFITLRIRVPSLRMRLRRRVIFELLDLACSIFIIFSYIRVGNETSKVIVFIYQMI